MKKVFAVLTIAAMFGFTACGPKAEENTDTMEQEAPAETMEEPAMEQAETEQAPEMTDTTAQPDTTMQEMNQ